jgi:hypothetical protein
MPLDQASQRQVNWGSSVKHAAEWTCDQLAATRTTAAQLRDSRFIWIHEQTHFEEIIERVDATVKLKRERDECARQRNGSRPRQSGNPEGNHPNARTGR